MAPRTSFAVLLAACAALCCVPRAAVAAPPAATGAKAPKPKPSSLEHRRELLAKYYLTFYGDSLNHSDWVTRAMAVLGLAKIDDPRATDLLLETMAYPFNPARARARARAKEPKQKLTAEQAALVLGGAASSARESNLPENSTMWRIGNNIVQAMAWEAIATRTGSLTPAQRKAWLTGTALLGRRGLLHGSMRATMLRLLAEQGPTPANLNLYATLFQNTHALYPGDAGVLQTMRAVLGKWRNPKLIKALILAMGKGLDDGPRADYLLRGMDNDVHDPTRLLERGTEGLWPTMQKAWATWYKQQDFKAPPGKVEPYKGYSKLIARAEVITPGSDKWSKDLELPRLRLDQLDVTFVIDATGSMQPVVNWIKRDVRKMLWALALLSREPRIGVTFYRDHGDEYVTKVHPLTDDGRKLARAIEATTAAGGDDVPEAVFDALAVAVLKQRWSRSEHGCRAVVLVGDAPPHERDMAKVEKLVRAAAAKGFRFFCVKARTKWGSDDLDAFDRIAEWGKGKSVWVDFRDAKLRKEIHEGSASIRVLAGGGFNSGDFGGIADTDADAESEDATRPDRVILREVFRSILADAYADRVTPFTNVLLEYLETPIKEKRLPVKSEAERERARRRNPGGRGRPPGQKPRNPQDR